MKNKKIAIIGASYLQEPLISKAKEMGIETHVFAWQVGDVGEKLADYFYPISIVEKKEILQKCQEIQVDGICTIASDLAAVTVCYVAEKMGLSGNSIQTGLVSTNKHEMRKCFERHDDPSPRSILVETVDDLKDMILGDRYEMLSVAIAAAMQKIPILHIHGGEATFANYDEFIRHSITKMSLYHYTATDEYRKRVIQLGEQPERVFYLGALGAENCLEIDLKNVPDCVTNLQDRQYFVVLFHPETLTTENPLVQIEQVLAAVEEHRGYQYVFLGTNADTHSDIMVYGYDCI